MKPTPTTTERTFESPDEGEAWVPVRAIEHARYRLTTELAHAAEAKREVADPTDEDDPNWSIAMRLDAIADRLLALPADDQVLIELTLLISSWHSWLVDAIGETDSVNDFDQPPDLTALLDRISRVRAGLADGLVDPNNGSEI